MKMRLWTVALCTGLLASTSVGAACTGGTSFTYGGITYCISNVSMNWWSAFNWCQANGQVLAHIAKACPGIQAWPGTACSASTAANASSWNNVFEWTSMGHGENQAIAVSKYRYTGTANTTAYNRNTQLRALCVASN